MRRRHLALAVGSVLSLAACGFNFQDPGLLIDRRILGIAAEPPEIIIDPANPSAALNTPIQVTALVADPKDPGTPQSFTWSWCLTDLGTPGNYDTVSERCVENSSSLVQSGMAQLSQMTTTFSQMPQVFGLLQQAVGDSGSLAGLGGQQPTGMGHKPPAGLSTWLTFQLDVQGDANSKGALFGIKRVVLSTPGPGNRQANKNPHAQGLLFDDVPWDPMTPRPVQLKQCSTDNQTSVTDPATGKAVMVCQHRITPVFDASQAEKFQVQTLTPDAQGNYQTLSLQEVLSLQWVSDAGSFTSQVTQQYTGLGPMTYDPLSTKWIEPPEIGNGTVHFWIVVQDDRGGASWELRSLTLSP